MASLLFDSSNLIQEGYEQFKCGIFKVADFRSWTVIVSGPDLIEDIRKAPEDVLVFEAAIDEAVHSLGPKTRRSHFHVPIIQNQLTRELNDSVYDIRDEVIASFRDIVPSNTEWTKFPALGATLDVVSRTTHRVFVGLPLCRDPDYMSMNKQFALGISKASSLLRLFPSYLKRCIGWPFVDVPANLKSCMDHLRPVMQERLENYHRHGRNYSGKPQDLLSWFIDEVDGQSDEEKLKHVAFHLLVVNFGAVYTISTSFTQALYHLAAHPEHMDPLRKEIKHVTASEGWTKAAMGEMRLLDSFLKESQRISGLGAISSYRRVVKPFTFSNGTRVPAGMTIGVAAWSTHLDDSIYSNAHTFDGFRHAQDEHSQMVTPSPDFLAFGVGRHLCPGRFFTVTVLEAMMIHVIMNYDVKLETDGKRPEDSWFVTDNIPNSTANVLFKKRNCV
ncbi:hypothetical protein DXG01_003751 [Tephrocybe rancida]|nr:hypothetical protein DXG01_003751 [Tephrocybe rancida]